MFYRIRRIALSLAVGAGLAAVVVLSLTIPRAAAEATPLAAPHPDSAPMPTPVIVELFTSEGCSSCPPADKILADLTNDQPVLGARIIPLGLHVDYWDDLGWPDRFASPDFTQRQRAYAQAFGSNRIYTPQMIVDGAAEFGGYEGRRARDEIGDAAGRPHLALSLDVSTPNAPAASAPTQADVEVAISGFPGTDLEGGADVVLALTEDGLSSDVRRGENAGRRLEHARVVRSLNRIGVLASDPTSKPVRLEAGMEIQPDWNRSQLFVLAFVQRHRDHRIIGAAEAPLEAASK